MSEISRWVRGNHTLFMVICCTVPMVALAAIFVFKIPLDTIGLFAIMLLCPLLHLLMMRGMGHEGQHPPARCHDRTKVEQEPAKAGTASQTAGK